MEDTQLPDCGWGGSEFDPNWTYFLRPLTIFTSCNPLIMNQHLKRNRPYKKHWKSNMSNRNKWQKYYHQIISRLYKKQMWLYSSHFLTVPELHFRTINNHTGNFTCAAKLQVFHTPLAWLHLPSHFLYLLCHSPTTVQKCKEVIATCGIPLRFFSISYCLLYWDKEGTGEESWKKAPHQLGLGSIS